MGRVLLRKVEARFLLAFALILAIATGLALGANRAQGEAAVSTEPSTAASSPAAESPGPDATESSPEAEAEPEAQEPPYGDLDRGEALELAETTFEPELEATSGIYDELEPEKFLSDNSALVPAASVDGGPGESGESPPVGTEGLVLLESLLPLRTETDSGALRPVSLKIERSEGELQPQNPLTELGLPLRLGDGISLPAQGIGITLAGAPEDLAATDSEGNFAFYPEVATDTDLIAMPTAQGVETMTDVRSAEAPTRSTYDLSLPAGAELRTTEAGGAEVVENGSTILNVPPPTAIDAAGESVEATLSASGDTLSVDIEPGLAPAYPILVDPQFFNQQFSWLYAHNSLDSWNPVFNPQGPMRAVPYALWSTPQAAPGPDISNGFGGLAAGSGTEASWEYYVPRYRDDLRDWGGEGTSTWIYQVRAEGLMFVLYGNKDQYPALISGLKDPKTGWLPESESIHYGYEGEMGLNNSFASTNFKSSRAYKEAAMNMVTYVYEGPAKRRDAYMAGATVFLVDPETPTIKELEAPHGWMNATALPIGYEFEDTGLGVWRATMKYKGAPLEGAGLNLPCTGSAVSPCPRNVTSDATKPARQTKPGNLVYNPKDLPTGIDPVQVTVADPMGEEGETEHLKSQTIELKVDHKEPLLSVSGTLTEQATKGYGLARYNLHVAATDGTSTVKQSGVSKVEVSVDGRLKETFGSGCATQNCAVSGDWTMVAREYSRGPHVVSIVATDAVGLKSTPKTVTVDLGPPPQQLALAAFSFDEDTGLTALDATAGGPVGTLSSEGVSHVGGRYGGALQFDGTKGCVTIPDSAALQLREEFTLEAWVRPEGELTHLPILYKTGKVEGKEFPAYDLGIGLTQEERGEGQIGDTTGGHVDARTGSEMKANVWQHLAVVYDGGKLQLYLEGNPVGSPAKVPDPNSGVAGALTIGCGGGYKFKGRIDEVRIYSRALETAEVVADRGVPIQTARRGAVAAYPLDEDTGSVARDVAGTHDGALSAEGTKWLPSGGRYGGALQFDGAKGCVTVPDSEALRLGEEFTLEAWVRPEGALFHDPAIAKQAKEFPAYALGIGMAVPSRAEGQIGTEPIGHSDVSQPSPEANIWQFEALSFDGKALRLYVDGVPVKEETVIGKANSAAPGALQIGCSEGQHFRGRIDDVRIYGRALDESEVAVDRATPIQTPTQGPLAAYPLDEDTGSVARDVAGAHDGALSSEGTKWLPTGGRYGGALQFDGTRGCVMVPDSEALRLGDAFTLEAWVRPEGELTHLPILWKGQGSPAYDLGIGLSQAERGEGQIGTTGGGHTDARTEKSMQANVWQHLAVVYDGGGLQLYLEGNPVGSPTPVSGPNSVAAGALTIGCGGNYQFKGRIDEVRVYNRALAATEVAVDRESSIQIPKKGPVAAYSFDDGIGTTAQDVTGDGHAATIVGATWSPGRYGGGLEFKSSAHSVVKIPASPEFSFGEEFTLEAWVRPTTSSNVLAPIVGKTTGGGSGTKTFSYYLYGGDQESKPFGQIEPTLGQGRRTTAKEALPGGTWKHVALTYDGQVERIYVDGAEQTPVISSAPPVNTAGELQVGAETEHGDYLNGRIDEVRIYNRALAANEIAIDREVPLQTVKKAPVAAYSFDEGEGSVAHDVTGGLHEGALPSEGATWVSGRHGGALQFDGTRGCVTVPDSEALRLGEAFTLEAWVRPEGELTHLPIIYKGGTGSLAYDLGIGLNAPGRGEGQVGTGGGGHADAKTEKAMEANVWQHLAVVFDGGKLQLYLDGAKIKSTTPVTGPSSGVAGALTIGCGGGNYFHGRIDDVRVYDRALEGSEVAIDRSTAVVAPEQPTPPGGTVGPSLVAAFSFDEASALGHDSVEGGPAGTLSAEGTKAEAGRYGGALHLDGAKGCLTLESKEALQLGEDFTLEAWVRPEGELTHLPIVWRDGGGFPAYDLGIGLQTPGKGEAQVGAGTASSFTAASQASMEANVWQHLATTYDGSKLRLYLDGGLVATKAVTGRNVGSKTGAVTIGCGGGSRFRGRIDEVRIYNRALDLGVVTVDRETPLQTQRRGPVADWSFDEGEGATVHDGVAGGPEAGALGEGVSWMPGRYGTALKFDGTKGCLTVPDSAALQLGEEFTLEAWVRPEGELTHLPILYKDGGGFPAYDLGIGLQTPGKGEGQIGTTAKSSFTAASPASMQAEVWQHLATTYDGSRLRLYLDGDLVATKAVTGRSTGSETGAVTIGCGGEYHFHGRIDELRLYNRALSAGEVAVDRESPLQSPKRTLVASFPLDEGTGITAADSSGNKHTGTLSGPGVSFTTAGRYGGALQFTGAPGCVTLAEPEGLRLGEEFTLEAWVRPEGELTHLPIAWKEGEGSVAYDLGVGLQTPGMGEGQIGAGGARFTAASQASLEPGVWQHLATTYDGSKLRVYLNGGLVATKAVSGTTSGTKGAMTIGCGGGSYFSGRIDEVRLYNRALGAGEVGGDAGSPLQTPQVGPVAAYPLDEPEGATVAEDVTEGGHNGGLSAEGVKFTPTGGRDGGALQLDGVKGCVTIPDSAALQLGEEFTLEAWVRPEGALTHLPILWKSGGEFPAYDLGIGLTTAGRGEGQIGTASQSRFSVASPVSMQANVWQHLAVTFDGSKARLYLDAEQVATKAVTGTASGTKGGALTIGCGGGLFFRGRIDEVRAYDRALEASEVAVDRLAPIQAPGSSPVASYPLDEGEGTIARDVTGSGHDGTLSAVGVSWAPGRYGGALKFDGSRGCVTVPDSAALQLSEEFTLEAWVRPEGELLHLPAITKQASGFPAYGMGIGTTTAGKAEGQMGTMSKGHSDAVATSTLEANVWYHEALTFDGAKLRLYVNGGLVAEKAISSADADAPGDLLIGCSATQHFRGRIDEARIYDRALTTSEVPPSMPASPSVATEPPAETTANVAIVEGWVSPNGKETEYYFEHGLTTSYGEEFSLIDEFVGAEEEGRTEVSEALINLKPETTYHYRLVAVSPSGISRGADQTFTTGPRTMSLAEEEELRASEEAETPLPSARMTVASSAAGSAPSAAPANFYGMMWTGNNAQTTELMGQVADSGAKMFRIQVNPQLAETIINNREAHEEAEQAEEEKEEGKTPKPVKHEFEENAEMKVIAAAVAQKLTVLPYIGGGALPGRGQWFKFRSAAEVLVNHYGPGSNFSPEIKTWEIWNEPNMPYPGGKVNPELFGEFFAEMSTAIRHAAGGPKKVTVLSPGLFGYKLSVNCENRKGKDPSGEELKHPQKATCHEKPGDYLNAMGHEDYYDAISLHPYTFKHNGHAIGPHDVHGVREEVRQKVEEVRAGRRSTPVWVTELGFPVSYTNHDKNPTEHDTFPTVTGAVQAKLTNRIFQMFRVRSGDLDLRSAFFYNIADLRGDQPEGWDSGCGLLSESGAPREAYAAYQQVVN